MQIPATGPQRRYYDHLSPRPRWGITKELYQINKKEHIIDTAKYIQLPNNKRQYVIIDADDPEIIDIWEREVLPKPTIQIINPTNDHQQLLFELGNKIILPMTDSTMKISFKAIKYFNSVSVAYTEKFNGDVGYSYAAMKNPFCPDWIVTWHDEVYDLDYLADFVDLKPRRFDINKTHEEVGRHMSMFNFARLESYKLIQKFERYEQFHEEIKRICWSYYNNNIANSQSDHPFYSSEVNSIANSISKWTWNRRNSKYFKRFNVKVGTMNLAKPISENKEEYMEQVKVNQSAGAKYVAEMRRKGTSKVIEEAILYLRNENLPVSVTAIVNLTGLSKATVYRYKDIIGKDNIRSYTRFDDYVPS